MVEYFKNVLLEQIDDLVFAPTVNYNYYPAFVEYPGSTSLRFEVARDFTVDICTSLAQFGPRKFYALNNGVSTLSPLEKAAEILAAQDILLRYSVLDKFLENILPEPVEGGHADEVETSIMLFAVPEVVDMTKVVRDFTPGPGRLTRNPDSKEGVYSPSGIWGDPTRATRQKGKVFVAAIIEGLRREIEAF